MTVKIGVLTSGGDAPGMNAAVRAVARTALNKGAEPYAIMEGWQGAVEGGDKVRKLEWRDVSSVLERGGTVIGTARSDDFRERWGMRAAALHLVEHGIDRLVVIGGDGTLSGTDEFRREWPSMLAELVASGEITQDIADAHRYLQVIGLVGSIDNDLVGTDTTIGADSALHRIIDAVDQISSTAASHQRTFIIEVMGRNCGYLPLMAAVAGGCDYVLIPEAPPAAGWEDEMVAKLQAGRAAGRRESIILVAEGAKDRDGNQINAHFVADVLKERTGEEPRVTILGHVQRGGTPSAYDRWMSTVLGYVAVQEVMKADGDEPAWVLGVRHNRVAKIPLVEAVARTRAVKTMVAEKRFDDAVASRGNGFRQTMTIMDILSWPPEGAHEPAHSGKRVAIVHAGGLAPGMNTAARAAVRLGIARGHTMLGVYGGFPGFAEGDVRELAWKDVDTWAFSGGAELGTRRSIPELDQLYALGRAIEEQKIDALLVIGGYNAYLAAQTMVAEVARYPAFRIPIICVPASIDNNLPGTELSIGADTAVNNSVWALDRVKESAAASQRCFVAESMGRYCGYLAQMSGLSAGAELVYTHEHGVTLDQISADARRMAASFEEGRRLFLVVRNEEANPQYNLDFMGRAFEETGGGLFDVRTDAIGHLQQGGTPSPFDRLLATRLVYYALDDLDQQFEKGEAEGRYVGFSSSYIETRPLKHMDDDVVPEFRRPKDQWWLQFAEVGPAVSLPGAPADHEVPVVDGSFTNSLPTVVAPGSSDGGAPAAR